MKIETLAIDALAYGGAGVGRLADGRVCFAAGALPGERVKVQITAEKKRFVTGKTVEVLTPSSDRIAAVCPLAGECPGCVYMHCSYELETCWKERQLRDFLVRGLALDPQVIAPPFVCEKYLHYRNKLVLHRDKSGRYGYFGEDNISILPVKECFLADEKINAVLSQARGERALFRCTDGKAGLIDPAEPGVLQETVADGGKFLVSGSGFFQTNPAAAAELVREVLAAYAEKPVSSVLELYCGVGVFSIALARRFDTVCCVGVEVDQAAVRFAKKNAELNAVTGRCKFFAGDAGKTLRRISREFDLLILDPPRSGIAPESLEKILALDIPRIICISCAADTLTRDLKKFIAAGYSVKKARMVDMFPRTGHFEVFTLLEK